MASKFIGDHSGDGSLLTNVNAQTLDGIDSGQFLRKDINGEFVGQLTVDNTAKLSSSYSWTNSAIQTTSLEIIDANTNDASVCPTLIMHNYGDGGVKFRMGNYGDKTLYLSSGQASGAGNPVDDNAGTYFNALKINGNTVWHQGNDGSGSGLDADTIDGIQAASFLRSDTADTWTGKLTYAGSNEGLEVAGIRGTAIGSQTGDFIHLYERVNIGYPSGWGGQAAPPNGLSTHGGAQFNVGNVAGAPFTFSGNTVWHAGNDGAGSGLDADTVDGIHAASFLRGDTADTFTTLTGSSLDVSGELEGQYIGVGNSANNTGYGLSLYGGGVAGQPTYGIMFAGTGTFGTHGAVTADWATYFTMNNTAGRGWVFRNATGAANVASISNAGHAVFNGDVTAYSDERMKDNIVEIEGALDKVSQLRGITFNHKSDGTASTGLIAQEVQRVLPEAISEDSEGMLAVKYGNMVGLLIEGMKEMKELIEAQQAKINELEEKLNGK